MDTQKEKTFNLGLTMAGAISAGAYTGGVFDFLIEALDAWESEKAKLRDKDVLEWPVPCHDVVIPVISGASAGGIAGAIGFVAVGETAIDRRPEQKPADGAGKVMARLDKLYDAWVVKPRFVAEGNALLGTADLKRGPLVSLLDTTILDEVGAAMLEGVTAAHPRPYFAAPTHLFLTHCNLRGVPYDVPFIGGAAGQPGYPMTGHGDRIHYRVEGIGAVTFHSVWADPDAFRPIDLRNMSDNDKTRFVQCTLGTSAFPVALTARKITGVTLGDVIQRQWTLPEPYPVAPYFRLPPAVPTAGGGTVNVSALMNADAATIGAAPEASIALDYVTVDGGTIDNQPFQLARWTLMEHPPQPNVRREEAGNGIVDRAVLMIDPFPERSTVDPSTALDNTLRAVIARLIPTMVQQARFKPDELMAALREDVYSRFLIAPRRRKFNAGDRRHQEVEKFAIACGLLGGFGGFLSEAFRAHDYQLGRLNCYLFLKEHFALPANYRVVERGYENLHPAARNTFAFSDNSQEYLPIIPLVGTAATAPTPPEWPRVDGETVDALVAAAMHRADALIKTMLRNGSGQVRIGGSFLWMLGRGGVADYIRTTVLRELIRRDQFDEARNLSPLQRDVLVAIVGSADTLRTTRGLAKQTGHCAAKIEQAIKELGTRWVWPTDIAGPEGVPTYRLAGRTGHWLGYIPGAAWISTAIFGKRPKID